MAKPFDKQPFDAFTPTGSGHSVEDMFAAGNVPDHEARYKGRPPYMTDASEQAKLKKKGAEYGTL